MSTHVPPPAKHAFTLVELAIVLVIIGLLVGGVLVGQALISAAQLRTVSKDITHFTLATQTFRTKYGKLPGDIPNATAYWGTAPVCPGTEANPSTDGTTCNGNDNGQLESVHEYFRYWQHLANAGLIPGSYTGVRNTSVGGGAWTSANPGVNVPKSRMHDRVGYSTQYNGTMAGSAAFWDAFYGNNIRVGLCNLSSACHDEFFTNEQARDIDEKMDDGFPSRGSVRTLRKSLHSLCATTNDPATTAYDLSVPDSACALIFPKLF